MSLVPGADDQLTQETVVISREASQTINLFKKVFEGVVDNKETRKAIGVVLNKMGLKPEAKKDGFLYNINIDGSNRPLIVYVSLFHSDNSGGSDTGPYVRVYLPNEQDNKDIKAEIENRREKALLQITTKQKTAKQVLEGKLDPVKAVLSRQIRLNGSVAFVMHNTKHITEFFRIVGSTYQKMSTWGVE